MKHQRPKPSVDSPMLVTDAAPAQSLAPAAHPAPTAHADDPERPASIHPDVWRLLRRYSHLIAVDERKLRGMLAQAPNDAQIACELTRVGNEIDVLRTQIATLADLPDTNA